MFSRVKISKLAQDHPWKCTATATAAIALGWTMGMGLCLEASANSPLPPSDPTRFSMTYTPQSSILVNRIPYSLNAYPKVYITPQSGGAPTLFGSTLDSIALPEGVKIRYSCYPESCNNLSLNSTTGVLTGLPTRGLGVDTIITATVTLSSSSNQSTTFSLNSSVITHSYPDPGPLNVTYSPIPSVLVGNNELTPVLPTVTGIPSGISLYYAFASPLPTPGITNLDPKVYGLSIDSGTGAISGSPSQVAGKSQVGIEIFERYPEDPSNGAHAAYATLNFTRITDSRPMTIQLDPTQVPPNAFIEATSDSGLVTYNFSTQPSGSNPSPIWSWAPQIVNGNGTAYTKPFNTCQLSAPGLEANTLPPPLAKGLKFDPTSCTLISTGNPPGYYAPAPSPVPFVISVTRADAPQLIMPTSAYPSESTHPPYLAQFSFIIRATPQAKSIYTLGQGQSCALMQNSKLYCWGGPPPESREAKSRLNELGASEICWVSALGGPSDQVFCSHPGDSTGDSTAPSTQPPMVSNPPTQELTSTADTAGARPDSPSESPDTRSEPGPEASPPNQTEAYSRPADEPPNPEGNSTPTNTLVASGSTLSSSTGTTQTCGIVEISGGPTSSGSIACWPAGSNSPAADSGTSSTPQGHNFTQVSVASDDHACALDLDGAVSCWNNSGTLQVPSFLH